MRTIHTALTVIAVSASANAARSSTSYPSRGRLVTAAGRALCVFKRGSDRDDSRDGKTFLGSHSFLARRRKEMPSPRDIDLHHLADRLAADSAVGWSLRPHVKKSSSEEEDAAGKKALVTGIVPQQEKGDRISKKDGEGGLELSRHANLLVEMEVAPPDHTLPMAELQITFPAERVKCA